MTHGPLCLAKNDSLISCLRSIKCIILICSAYYDTIIILVYYVVTVIFCVIVEGFIHFERGTKDVVFISRFLRIFSKHGDELETVTVVQGYTNKIDFTSLNLLIEPALNSPPAPPQAGS